LPTIYFEISLGLQVFKEQSYIQKRMCVCQSLSVCISRKNYIYCWLLRHCYVFLLLEQLKQRRFYGRLTSYSLPHFYEHNPSRRRKRRLPDDSEKLHYGLTFDGKDHHVELWPNHDFISPGMMIEKRGVGASLDINNVKIRRANTARCHYTGRVRRSDYSEPGDKHTLYKNSTP
jgi:hypothetical protein